MGEARTPSPLSVPGLPLRARREGPRADGGSQQPLLALEDRPAFVEETFVAATLSVRVAVPDRPLGPPRNREPQARVEGLAPPAGGGERNEEREEALAAVIAAAAGFGEPGLVEGVDVRSVAVPGEIAEDGERLDALFRNTEERAQACAQAVDDDVGAGEIEKRREAVETLVFVRALLTEFAHERTARPKFVVDEFHHVRAVGKRRKGGGFGNEPLGIEETDGREIEGRPLLEFPRTASAADGRKRDGFETKPERVPDGRETLGDPAVETPTVREKSGIPPLEFGDGLFEMRGVSGQEAVGALSPLPRVVLDRAVDLFEECGPVRIAEVGGNPRAGPGEIGAGQAPAVPRPAPTEAEEAVGGGKGRGPEERPVRGQRVGRGPETVFEGVGEMAETDGVAAPGGLEPALEGATGGALHSEPEKVEVPEPVARRRVSAPGGQRVVAGGLPPAVGESHDLGVEVGHMKGGEDVAFFGQGAKGAERLGERGFGVPTLPEGGEGVLAFLFLRGIGGGHGGRRLRSPPHDATGGASQRARLV